MFSKQVKYTGPSILPDNEMYLILQIQEIVRYTDPDYFIELHKKEDELIVHIQPSVPEFKQKIVNDLLFINKTMKMKVTYSSSLAISKKISFRISLKTIPLFSKQTTYGTYQS